MSRQRLRIFAEGIFYSTIKYCTQIYGNVFGFETYKVGGSWYSSLIYFIYVQQIIAVSTMTTAVKILKTKNPKFSSEDSRI